MIDNTYKVDDCVVLHEDETSFIYYGKVGEVHNNSIIVYFYSNGKNYGMSGIHWWFGFDETEIKKDPVMHVVEQLSLL